MNALPSILHAVGEKTEVMLDGGIRRGSDVLKALALGARFVFVGRPFLYAASVGGSAGVLMAAEILKSEIYRNMALLGVTNVGEIDQPYLCKV